MVKLCSKKFKRSIKCSITWKLNDFWSSYKCGKFLNLNCTLILVSHITNFTFLCRTQICRWFVALSLEGLGERPWHSHLPVFKRSASCLSNWFLCATSTCSRSWQQRKLNVWMRVCVLQHFHATICQRSLNLIIIIIIIQLHHHHHRRR